MIPLQESTSDLLSAVEELLPDSRSSISYAAGTVVFEEGEIGNCAYIVESGSVRMTRMIAGRERTVSVAGPGDMLGELVLLGSAAREFNAVAVEDAELLVVSGEQLEREMRNSAPLIRMLVRVLAERTTSIARLVSKDIDADTTMHDDASAIGQDTSQVKAVFAVRLERQIRLGLERREFEIYYQPVVSIKARKLVGFEALVRWVRPDEGIVSPNEFIPIAETTGLILPLGSYVLESAVKFAHTMRQRIKEAGLKVSTPFISVNVSPRQLESEKSVERMLHVLNESKLRKGSLKLEITESILLENPETAGDALRRLKETGVTLAVDDFGTGYASLSYMPRYPLDTLKIDRSFVMDIQNHGNHQVIRSMVVLARGLGMDIVAEGVETKEQLASLAKLGCDNAQGFLFARPLPAFDAMSMVVGAIDEKAGRNTFGAATIGDAADMSLAAAADAAVDAAAEVPAARETEMDEGSEDLSPLERMAREDAARRLNSDEDSSEDFDFGFNVDESEPPEQS